MKIMIYEWVYDKEQKVINLRAIKDKVKVKYMPEMDNYVCTYKKVPIPLKLDYIKEFKLKLRTVRIFNVINYENSFVPFAYFDINFEKIDNIVSKPDKLVEKIKLQLDVVKALEEKKHQFEKFIINNRNEEDKKLEVKQAKVRIKELEEKIAKTKIPTEFIIKACALPMSIRSWYIQNLKRLKSKHSGWLEKYGTVLAMLLFMAFSLAMVYVVIKTTGDVSADNIDMLVNGITRGIRDGLVGGLKNQGVTTLPVLTPP